MIRFFIVVVCLVAILAAPARAQIVLDGTVGPSGPLNGPNYQIPNTVGTQAGGNLFHSFETFNIANVESATFTGPGGINNVISRVTGGELSNIDGRLESQVPGADFWFINPAGVLFGANAEVNVPGAFRVSSADKIQFTDGSIYSATDPGASTLTLAPPSAFGFLGNGPAGNVGSVTGGEGSVTIVAPVPDPEVSLAATLVPLPDVFLDPTELLREPCAARHREGRASSLIFRRRDGVPVEPDGLLPSPLYDGSNKTSYHPTQTQLYLAASTGAGLSIHGGENLNVAAIDWQCSKYSAIHQPVQLQNHRR
jgi:filamentous hemagglutinin family protein